MSDRAARRQGPLGRALVRALAHRLALVVVVVVVVVLSCALAAWAPGEARADGPDVWFDRGRKALAEGTPEAAAEAFSRARELAPGRADICYHLAKARELDGHAADAIAFYREAARLAGSSPLSRTAKADEERLRGLWVRVEFEQGQEMLETGQFRAARAAFERAFDVAREADMRDARRRAREGYTRAAAREIAREALAGLALRPITVRVVGSTMPQGQGAPGLSDMAALLEAELGAAVRDLGAEVLGPRATDAPTLSIRSLSGQRFLVTAEDKQGRLLAKLALRALVDAPAANALPPELITLDVAIEAERDDQSPPRRIPVTEGSVLLSGDRFRIRVRPSRDAYLYIAFLDAQGQAYLLYPGTEAIFPDLARAGVTTPNPLRGKVDCYVPPRPPVGEPLWFYLDEHTGTETFYVAASVVPLDDVEDLVDAIKQAGEAGRRASAELAGAIAGRAGATQVGASDDSDVEVLQGRGAVFRYISFTHR